VCVCVCVCVYVCLSGRAHQNLSVFALYESVHYITQLTNRSQRT